jgi:hypothetical protein
MVVNFDEVLVNRKQIINPFTPVSTVHKISGSQRKNKKRTYEFQHFYPVQYGTTFQSDDIAPITFNGSLQLNTIIAQQILNDNRTHVKRYSVSVYANDFGEFLYPYHKININMTGFQSGDSCIIDRMKYSAKSGIYNIECHETNQDTNVSITTQVISGPV